MSQIAALEHAIAQMNPARFQEILDLILMRKFPNAKIFACVGSQYGKEKTVSGTPDTYIEDDEQVFYVEYSTDISSGISKIRKDIDKCLVDIVERQISEKTTIIISANFKISKDNQISVVDYVESRGCKCLVYDGQYIARLIMSDYKDLASECGLQIDTGQVIGIEKFLIEYAKKGGQFAISLSTKFLHRTNELNTIINHLRKCDIILISGAPGVGKSRISIEAIKDFCSSEDYFSKCISYKEESLLSDLNSNLIEGRNYVILVDDVNRVNHIGQILEFQNSYIGGHLKLILTVRN
ncbi:MAG: ATP-binding protein [Bacteroides sp.]|nr:ATP-binding protein [Bacteroides sp.]